MLVLGYLLPLVSKAAPYLDSGLGGTFPLILRMNIGNSCDAASSGKKDASIA